MPGVMAPPTYAPSRETQSKVVAVPKSTTMAGVPYSRATATVRRSSSAEACRRTSPVTPGWKASGMNVTNPTGDHQLHAAPFRHDGGHARESRYDRGEGDAGDVGHRGPIEAEQAVDQDF